MADDKKNSEAEVEPLVMPKRSPLVPLLLVVNFLGLLGVGGYFLFLRPEKAAQAAGNPLPPASSTAPSPAGHAAAPAALAPESGLDSGGGNGPLMTLENFIVNLADEEVNRYLKVGLSLELASEEVAESIRKKEPVIRNAIITLTSALTFADIRTVKGKRQLRRKMTQAINTVMGAPVVRTVFFNEFVVQ